MTRHVETTGRTRTAPRARRTCWARPRARAALSGGPSPPLRGRPVHPPLLVLLPHPRARAQRRPPRDASLVISSAQPPSLVHRPAVCVAPSVFVATDPVRRPSAAPLRFSARTSGPCVRRAAVLCASGRARLFGVSVEEYALRFRAVWVHFGPSRRPPARFSAALGRTSRRQAQAGSSVQRADSGSGGTAGPWPPPVWVSPSRDRDAAVTRAGLRGRLRVLDGG